MNKETLITKIKAIRQVFQRFKVEYLELEALEDRELLDRIGLKQGVINTIRKRVLEFK